MSPLFDLLFCSYSLPVAMGFICRYNVLPETTYQSMPYFVLLRLRHELYIQDSFVAINVLYSTHSAILYHKVHIAP